MGKGEKLRCMAMEGREGERVQQAGPSSPEENTGQQDFPETGEVVLCKVFKILDYGVFVELLEYEPLQGFVHISQVASSWIKNIRNFVKENQIRAARVVNIDPRKRHVDLSFTKVSAAEQKAKLEAWKQLKKPQKLIEMLAKQHSQQPDAMWKEIAEPLLENYESLHSAFITILAKGPDAAKGVPQKWLKPLHEIISKNMALPVKTVRGVLSLTSTAPNGVELIRAALLAAQKSATGTDTEIFYSGSGRYAVKVSSNDFKTAEHIMKGVADAAISALEGAGGRGGFERIDGK